MPSELVHLDGGAALTPRERVALAVLLEQLGRTLQRRMPHTLELVGLSIDFQRIAGASSDGAQPSRRRTTGHRPDGER
jgi:uncharacterized protein (DUF924 family)